MRVGSPLEATVAVLVVLVGLLIGGMVAILTRPSNVQEQRVTVAGVTNSQSASHLKRPAPTTVEPTAKPVPSASSVPTASAAAVAPQGGLWRIQEANVQVGTIVWSGAGAVSSGDAIALDVHKESVGGRAAYPCERRTTLRAVVSPGASAQTVPYQEVNCSGATSTGEMRISGFSGDGRSFSGTFWSNGSKLGDFTALRTSAR